MTLSQVEFINVSCPVFCSKYVVLGDSAIDSASNLQNKQGTACNSNKTHSYLLQWPIAFNSSLKTLICCSLHKYII